MSFSDEELAFLRENEEGRQYNRLRWLGSENARPIIDGLMERGLMQPAYGEFKMRETPGDSISLAGRTIPVLGTMISLYMLRRAGEQLYEAVP